MSGREAGRLEQPWTRRALMIELAHGRKTQTQLAGEFGVTQGAISLFADRWRDEIQAIRDNDMDEFTGIELAKKSSRLELLQSIVEKAMQPVPKVSATKDGYVFVRDENGDLIKEVDGGLAGRIAKQIAEELGQLPTKVQLSGEIGVAVNYSVNGVTPEDLK